MTQEEMLLEAAQTGITRKIDFKMETIFDLTI